MAITPTFSARPRVLVVGGGYVGLYTAFKLQKKIAKSGGIVTLVDPQGSVTSIDHENRTAVIAPVDGAAPIELAYHDVVIAAGAITRTFPIKGLAESGIGLKTIEEAVALRNQVLSFIEQASTESDPEARKRALTFVVVGGGFAGIETIAELEDMARAAVKLNDRVEQSELRFVLVEAMGRIMPEVTEKQAEWVVEHLRSRGVEVLLNTSLDNAEEKNLKLINLPDKTVAQQFDADTLIWTAGVMANPMVRSTDFPLEPRGRVSTNVNLQISGEFGVIDNAWAAGDVAAVPDVTGGLPDGTCVPNAQHALRQAKRLAKNLWASRFNKPMTGYKHKNLGAVAGFGQWQGVAKIMGIQLKGPLAWLAHRGYHGLAMPTVERKFRVIMDWLIAIVAGRDLAQLEYLDDPRKSFVTAATPAPKPAAKPADAPVAAPAEKKEEVTASN